MSTCWNWGIKKNGLIAIIDLCYESEIQYENELTVWVGVWPSAMWSMAPSSSIVGRPEHCVSNILNHRYQMCPCWIYEIIINTILVHISNKYSLQLTFLYRAGSIYWKLRRIVQNGSPIGAWWRIAVPLDLVKCELEHGTCCTRVESYKNWKYWYIMIFSNIVKYLQSLLTEAEHQKIDEVSRQPMLEKYTVAVR